MTYVIGLRLHQVSVMLFSIVASVAGSAPASGDEVGNALVVPAGTQVHFHVDSALSSSESKTGQHFSFTLLEPIAVGSRVVAAAGSQGAGTVVLAGHAGTSGHEGDLTLRLDSVRTVDGNRVAFADQRFQINGRNRKVTSSVLGFIPFAGMGARFIRGSESRVTPDRPIETTLKNSANVSAATDSATPSPSPAR